MFKKLVELLEISIYHDNVMMNKYLVSTGELKITLMPPLFPTSFTAICNRNNFSETHIY